MGKSLYDHCVETGQKELLRQWHPEKNGDLTPDQVPAGTLQKVWWRCGKGHEWQARIAARAGNDDGCPVCAGKVIIPGENDLASAFPDFAAQWHPEKNGDWTPQKVSPYSNRKAWWQCERGHVYASVISSRTKGKGCPYCKGVKVLAGFNDLATLEPEVAEQWHPTLNGELTPEMVTIGSHRKVWWQCPLGHEWKALIYSRTGRQRAGCPVCAGRVSEKKQERYRSMMEDL